MVAKARGFAEQVRRTALHTPWHPRATRVTAGTARCTVPRVPLGSPKAKPRPKPEPSPAPAIACAAGGGDAGARDAARGGGGGEQPSQGAARAGHSRSRANYARRCSRREAQPLAANARAEGTPSSHQAQSQSCVWRRDLKTSLHKTIGVHHRCQGHYFQRGAAQKP